MPLEICSRFRDLFIYSPPPPQLNQPLRRFPHSSSLTSWAWTRRLNHERLISVVGGSGDIFQAAEPTWSLPSVTKSSSASKQTRFHAALRRVIRVSGSRRCLQAPVHVDDASRCAGKHLFYVGVLGHRNLTGWNSSSCVEISSRELEGIAAIDIRMGNKGEWCEILRTRWWCFVSTFFHEILTWFTKFQFIIQNPNFFLLLVALILLCTSWSQSPNVLSRCQYSVVLLMSWLVRFWLQRHTLV